MIRHLVSFLPETAMGIAAILVAASPALARCEDHVPQPKPQNAGRDIVGADLDTIIDRGYIEFAAYEAFAPWSYEDAGKIVGVDIEIGKLIAQSIGVEPRFKLVPAAENLDADLRNWLWKGPIVGGAVANVMLHAPYDSELACRIEQVVFTGTYHVETIGIAYRKDQYPDEKPIPAYFRFDTVAVENDSIADFYLTSFPGGQLGQNIRRYPTMQDAMTGLNANETMAAMGPLGQLEFGAREDVGIHTPPLPGFAVGKWTIGVGVHFAYRPLAYAVEDAIFAAASDGRLEKIFDDFGITYSPPALR